MRRVVVDANRVITDMGRDSRLFTGYARQAALLLVTRCDHPGCDLPAEFCDVDHNIEWADGGRTDQNNARPRCSTHNRFKSRNKWQVNKPPTDTTTPSDKTAPSSYPSAPDHQPSPTKPNQPNQPNRASPTNCARPRHHSTSTAHGAASTSTSPTSDNTPTKWPNESLTLVAA